MNAKLRIINVEGNDIKKAESISNDWFPPLFSE